MESTPRFRVFDSRRSAFDLEEEAPGRLPRRRMVTSGLSVARQRRRNRKRPGAHRGLALAPRLLAWFGAASSRRRRLPLLLLLAACGTGVLVSARLLSWASSSSSSSSSWSTSSLRPQSDAGGNSAVGINGEDAEGRPHQRGRGGTTVSLGPDAIPSVVLVERRAPLAAGHSRPGGARKASGPGEGGSPGGGTLEAPQEEEEEEETDNSSNSHRCLNTLQGMTLIADSEGRVCRRVEVDGVHRPGCCAAGPVLLPGEADVRGGHGVTGEVDHGAPPEGRYTDRRVVASGSATTATQVEDPGGAHEERGRLELVALSQAMHDGGGGNGVENDGFPPDQALSTPFSCWSCDVERDNDGSFPSSCCRVYEFCVSCCQAPGRQEERHAIGEAAALSGHPAYRELRGPVDSFGNDGVVGRTERLRATVEARSIGEEGREEGRERRRAQEEAFAHCAFRCRTYSGSVAHENSYRSPLKHCFGRFRPPAESAAMAAAAGGGGVGGSAEIVPVEGGRVPPRLQLDPFLAI